ncbi:MAG: PAC2 family protein [Chitinispirillaceae bacterium]
MSNDLILHNQNEQKEISFSNAPVLIAAWPGLGNVALMAADHIRKKTDAKVYGSIDLRPFFIPPAGVVKNGRFLPPEPLVSTLHYKVSPDLLIYESNLEPGSSREGMFLMQQLFEVAKKHNVRQILTVSAIPQPVSHTREPKLYFAANSDSVSEKLKSLGVEPLPAGEIPGPAGILPGMASGIEAACILVTMPAYAGTTSYPKASLSVLRLLRELVGFSIDLEEVKEGVERMEEQFEIIEEKVREHFPAMLAYEEQENSAEAEEFEQSAPSGPKDDIPAEAREKIEALFREVARDRSRAVELKTELDRWGLFRRFEDRFLDLFR